MAEASAGLVAGRAAYASGAWAQAYAALAAADHADPLAPADLELLARSAYLLGRDDDYTTTLERAHHAHLAAGNVGAAVLCAFWIGHNRMFRGDQAQALGWFGRAQRALEAMPDDCVERGWLLIPVWLEQLGTGNYVDGIATATQAAELGERFGDADLVWLARDEQGRGLLHLGRVEEAVRLVTEVLVAANAGELSPIVTGIVYCNTIAFCNDAFELGLAREWTEALSRWCDRHPEMVAHLGLCLVHRAEVMQLGGAWPEALAEARLAADRFTDGALNQIACGKAHYRQGELHRLRGEYDDAEKAYRAASGCGCEPQPGFALLRLAQGRVQDAASAIRRAVGERTEPLSRAGLLPAYVEIMLRAGEHERAEGGCRELEELAGNHPTEAIAAMAAQARGAVALADGDAAGALAPLRRAWRSWQRQGAQYEAAALRVLLGRACQALGDSDSADLELAAARETFERLSAAPALADLAALLGREPAARRHGLSDRELDVLRLVRAGRSNREIAAVLTISEHTVARHLQNVYVKLGVSSRTAASTFAFEHDLV